VRQHTAPLAAGSPSTLSADACRADSTQGPDYLPRDHAGWAPTALAEDTGRITGRVVDHTGAAFPGATIDLIIDTREWTTTSDDNGDYRFEGLPSGAAELTYRLLNFNVQRRNVKVVNGGSVAVDVVLTLSFSAALRLRSGPP
jgi:hypothetical protein